MQRGLYNYGGSQKKCGNWNCDWLIKSITKMLLGIDIVYDKHYICEHYVCELLWYIY